MSELRKDIVLNRWVIISTERGKRPIDSKSVAYECRLDVESCPFCSFYSSSPSEPQIKVVPEKYPLFSPTIPLVKEGEGMYDKISDFGYHEIIIESPNHKDNLFCMSYLDIKAILRVYKERVRFYSEDIRIKKKEDIRYVFIFKNYGYEAGDEIYHPTSHLMAMPIIPKATQEELKGAQIYFNYKNRCVYCDIVKEETRLNKERLIIENKNFIAFIPFAPRFPYEIWILGKRHTPFFHLIDDDEIESLAKLISELFIRISRLLQDPSYNLILHNSPLFSGKEAIDDIYHWHFEIIFRLTKLAGFEWGSGFYINPVIPEEAAKNLREV